MKVTKPLRLTYLGVLPCIASFGAPLTAAPSASRPRCGSPRRSVAGRASCGTVTARHIKGDGRKPDFVCYGEWTGTAEDRRCGRADHSGLVGRALDWAGDRSARWSDTTTTATTTGEGTCKRYRRSFWDRPTTGAAHKASCEAGSLTLGADDALGSEENHVRVARALIEKLGWWHDEARGDRYGDWVYGGTAEGYVFVCSVSWARLETPTAAAPAAALAPAAAAAEEEIAPQGDDTEADDERCPHCGATYDSIR